MASNVFHYSGYAWGVSDQALFLLANEDDSDPAQVINVHRVDVRPVAPTSFITGIWALARISARSGGIAVPTIAFQSDSQGDLPLGAVTTMSDVTVSTLNAARGVFALPFPSAAGQGLTSAYGGQGVDNSTIIAYRKNANVEPIMLGDGEGIAIVNRDDINTPYPSGWRCTLLLRIDGVRTHQAVFHTAPVVGAAAVAVFRDVGTIQIEILEISMEPIGPPTINSGGGNLTDTPLLRFARTASYDASNGGELVSPMSFDSSQSPPAAAKLYVSRAWNPIDRVDLGFTRAGYSLDDFGYPQLNTALVRKAGVIRQPLMAMMINKGPTVTPIGPFSEFQVQSTQKGISYNGNTEPFRIRARESFAAIINNVSCFNSYYFELEYTVDVPAPGGVSESASEFIG